MLQNSLKASPSLQGNLDYLIRTAGSAGVTSCRPADLQTRGCAPQGGNRPGLLPAVPLPGAGQRASTDQRHFTRAHSRAGSVCTDRSHQLNRPLSDGDVLFIPALRSVSAVRRRA